jgi:hypothetical protein
MTYQLQATVRWQRTGWQIVVLALLLIATSGLAMAQQVNQQTDKERKEAEKQAKQQAKEEERKRKEEEKRAKKLADKKGCPFTPVRPIPEGKAVIYLYKAWYGHGAFPIRANGQLITHLQKGGYFPYIVSPGKQELFVSAGGFMGTPTTIVNAEPGKEYYLELTTRFSAKLHVHPEEKGLKKIGDDLLVLPYLEYERTFQTMEEVYSDPVVNLARSRYHSDSKMPASSLLIDLAKQGADIDVEGEFKGGTLHITRKLGLSKVVIKQYGFAIDCSDQGMSSQ